MTDFETCTRREFLHRSAMAGSAVLAASSIPVNAVAQNERPNIILIMTDDQGYGDLGAHGNEKIKTPNLDRLAKQSVEFTQFYVCPVCAPTRASLMTGRYNYRTGVVDTYLGRAMMHTDEITIAEVLGKAGYRTGIFGKWHLGDNYPLRTIEQGFQESLVHKGGGIGQPSDPPGNRYFDPILQHNGVDKRVKGYCTDIFTDATIQFIEKTRNRPFFAYLSTNAPHTPLQIDDSYVKPYLNMGLDETTAKIYGMVTNIDENVGKLMRKLDETNLSDNTIVIFLTDNGPQQKRYTAGLRGRKGSVYEGGIRVPCYIRWPRKLKAGKKIDRIAAHIDMMPTLLDACGASLPQDRKIDGRSVMPLLTGEAEDWPDRTLFFQWHRGDEPEPFRACAARNQRYKLVNGKELYDIQNDPGEKNDISDEHPDIVKQLRKEYEEWFQDVSSTRGYFPPRIYIGTPHENPVTLTPQDWRGPDAGWGKDSLGYWEVDVRESGNYDVTLRMRPAEAKGHAHFKLGDVSVKHELDEGASLYTFESVHLGAGEGRLEAWFESDGKKVGVRYVDVKSLAKSKE